MKICFISGHLDLSAEEFELHYRPLIINITAKGIHSLWGMRAGLMRLRRNTYGRSVRMPWFITCSPHRGTIRGVRTAGGFVSDNERDKALTAASSTDIVWVRPGRELSGTARNIERRKTPTTR